MGIRSGFFNAFLAFIAVTVLVTFQNCSQVNYTLNSDHSTSSSKIPDLAVAEGGEVYDGKLRILHHYVDGFQCEGRPQPESILLSRDDTNWLLIQNTPEKCAAQDKVPVAGVVYDSATKQAVYQGKTYIPPKPFYVDASEDPNFPDKKLEDGVCEDVNNKCSLLAAVQQAGVVSYTSDSAVEIPSATYRLTNPMDLRPVFNGHSIHIRGSSTAAPPVLEGQGLTSHLYIISGSAPITLENLRFTNGLRVPLNLTPILEFSFGKGEASAITLGRNFNGTLRVRNTQFDNNKGAAVISQHWNTAQIIVQNSKFTDNDGGSAIRITEGRGLTVEDSNFVNNASGISAVYGKDVHIDRSTFTGSRSFAISLTHCKNCLVRNSTIFNNASALSVSTFEDSLTLEVSPKIINSTLVQNGLGGSTPAPSIHLAFQSSDHKLKIINSALATNGLGNTLCQINRDPNYFYTIEATNSLFDDASCALTGSGNLVGLSPMLGPFGDHGGLTPTLLPLPGSPLIDSGTDDGCPTIDQRGQSRLVDRPGSGSQCDIGAIEVP